MNATTILLAILSALATSVGWGFRGDYGHEAGAMVPGALLGLAVCLASGRQDWWDRAALLGFLGAVGWAFGGSMSYGRIVGYTMHSSYADVAYGFACLFVIGTLWGGIGSAFLGLGLTRPRSEFQRFAGPLIALYFVWLSLDFSGATLELIRRWSLNDSDWVAATSALLVALVYAGFAPRARLACAFLGVLATGWWLGFGVLTGLLGLRMTPPRGDNWSGCVGLFLALVAWLWATRNRAALLLTCYGLLAGGIGFAVGDFLNVLGRAQWGPIGRFEALQNLDYWKWMEQGFGLIMGLGVGLGAARLVRTGLKPPAEDEPDGAIDWIAPLFLLVLMMWHNFYKNVRTWQRGSHLGEGLFGLEPRWWFLLVGLVVSAAVVSALVRHRRHGLALVPAGAFGRAQLLFLLILWVPILAALLQAFPMISRKGTLFVHTSFWLTAGLCSLIVVNLSPRPSSLPGTIGPTDCAWRPSRRLVVGWLGVPLLLLALAYLATASHEDPLAGSHRRFQAATE